MLFDRLAGSEGIMDAKILVVDDEKLIVKGIRYSLEQEGMEVDCAYDGIEAVNMSKKKEYDVILLDVMLPGLTGYEVCQKIREKSDVPIIMLTAKSEDIDKIMGLEYGADDYVTKPFNILEVKARIKAIIRRNRQGRSEEPHKKSFEGAGLRLDVESRRVFVSDVEINLTAREFDILELLVFNPDKVYSREMLLNLLWDFDSLVDERIVDSHIKNLRHKIGGDYIETVRGRGYRIDKKTD